ncbi:type III pantothenate kinase [Bacteroidales bacterium]|nr:type III pantothenate kinase [Bacteroidales bacterium]
MQIIIDQGNSSTKLAIFDKGVLLNSFVYKRLDLDMAASLLAQYTPDYGILCSVADFDLGVLAFLKAELKEFCVLDEYTPLPILNKYCTPQSLGKDRLAALVGASVQAQGQALLVIDMGTAITIDFLDCDRTYFGGNISPGLRLRFEVLHKETRHLPLITAEGILPDMGFDSHTAIRSGVIRGIIFEIEGYIESFKQKYPQLLVFLTGGDSIYFERKIKYTIFADQNLVIKGLNTILKNNYDL